MNVVMAPTRKAVPGVSGNRWYSEFLSWDGKKRKFVTIVWKQRKEFVNIIFLSNKLLNFVNFLKGTKGK